MRIGYFGDGPWAALALEKITQDERFEIVFVTPRYDTQDPELKRWAEKLKVPFLINENVNNKEFLNQIKRFECDILVSMSFNQILRTDILQIAPQGFINCHAGALPFYRGRNPLNWVLINGEKEFGITVHYVDEGIDTGDIITQRLLSISEEDTYATLLERSFFHCADVLLEGLNKIKSATVKAIAQETIHPVGTYFGQRRQGDELINWSWPSERIFNFVRAITLPGPGARCYIDGKKEIAILKAESIEHAPEYISTCGEVIGRDNSGVVVKTGDTTLRITEVADVNEDGSLDSPRIPKLLIGRRLRALV